MLSFLLLIIRSLLLLLTLLNQSQFLFLSLSVPILILTCFSFLIVHLDLSSHCPDFSGLSHLVSNNSIIVVFSLQAHSQALDWKDDQQFQEVLSSCWVNPLGFFRERLSFSILKNPIQYLWFLIFKKKKSIHWHF